MMSEYFTDEEIVSQLKMFFTDEEQEKINFKSYFSLFEDLGSEWQVRIKNRYFRIDKITCDVEEVL